MCKNKELETFKTTAADKTGDSGVSNSYKRIIPYSKENNNLIVSAFFSKNKIDEIKIKEEWQVSKAESDKTQSADFTAKPLPSYSSNFKVPQTAQNINGNYLYENDNIDYSFQSDNDTNKYRGENSRISIGQTVQ